MGGQVTSAPSSSGCSQWKRGRGAAKVTFDFRETTAWQADYTPIDPQVSGGHDAVRVIEPTGRIIRLQHLLWLSRTVKPT